MTRGTEHELRQWSVHIQDKRQRHWAQPTAAGTLQSLHMRRYRCVLCSNSIKYTARIKYACTVARLDD